MAELRYHPLIVDWVMIASHRQGRPQMPRDFCPFCPGSGKVPDAGYDVFLYHNDFPALSVNPPVPDDVASGLFKTAPAYGRCEVLLYSPEHEAKLRTLSDTHMGKLAYLWRDTFADMAKDEKIQYCFLFENRGEPVGVTMPHPHGQAYGYPFIPKKIVLETARAHAYFKENGRCLFCGLLHEEQRDGRRIIFESKSFSVYLPFYCEYPYGVYISPKRHVVSISDLNDEELLDFGRTVKHTVGCLDHLFMNDFPYMMCMYNAPVDGIQYDKFFHFHVEFFPPMRSESKQKFNASSETGAWAHCNPTCPEEKALELREAYNRYLASN